MKKIFYLLFLFLVFVVHDIHAQGVGINPSGTPPDNSAILDVSANDKGMLIPRLTTIQRDSISNPAEALMIYNTTTKCFEAFNGVWQQIYCLCTPPAAVTAGTNIPSPTEITWTWNIVNNADGYKYNTVNDYSSATDVGSDTSYVQSGLACNTAYSLYVWAYNTCSNSPVVVLTQTTNGSLPATPTAGTHVVASTQITWNWNIAAGATGYKWNTSNDYNSATDISNSTTFNQTGLSPCTDYSLYVWSYNDCGPSPSAVILTASTNNTLGLVAELFINVGTSSWTAPTGVTSVEVLVVGGGGGGGINRGGGGGAGGLIYNASYSVIAGNAYTVIVGAGGAGDGSNGTNSTFDNIVAIGGGGGGGAGSGISGKNGGSGGGGEGQSGGGAGGTGTSGQGNAGGSGHDSNGAYAGGGGGGAGNSGSNASTTQDVGGNGGAGLAYSITGPSVYYAGGGGGGAWQSSGTGGSGGIGGGGNGGIGGAPGNNAAPNTGGGGGGGGDGQNGGIGGSGLVVIKYFGGQSLSVSAGSNSPVCEGSTLNLSASGMPGATYSWSGPNSFSSTVQNPIIPSITNTANGTYTVVASRGGCTLTANTTVTVIPSSLLAPTAATHSPSPTQVLWNWNSVSNATGYKYNTVNNYGTATDAGNNITYTQTGLACNTSYLLYVWAYNSCVNSPSTTLTQSTNGSLPSTPTEGTHSPSTNQIVWNWNNASGAAGYKYNTVNDYNTATDTGNTTTYTQTGLASNTAYTLYVWAYNLCGFSASPVTLTATTTSIPPIVTFNSAGTTNWTVPNGVTSINVKAWGAGGGGSNYSHSGGGGGYTSATFSVTSGETLTVIVGEGGKGNNSTTVGGGGAGAGNAGSGGGRSGVYRSSTALAVAGGGGGGGRSDQDRGCGGGAGGGANAQNSLCSSSWAGLGATQSGPGAGGAGNGGAPGASGSGFNGGNGGDGSPSNSSGGGGGGGYYGGGGGGDYCCDAGGGGGGGSGYYTGTGSTLTGSGSTPANSGDSDRAGSGQGGASTGNGSSPGSNGTDGIVIITW